MLTLKNLNRELMIVREGEIKDHEAIVSFQLAMAKETEGIELKRSIVENGVLAVLEDNAKGRYYVAEIDKKVVASLMTTYEWSDWRNGTILWIQSVYVLPKYRRKGVYRSMYSHLKQKVLDDRSLNGIRLYADKSNSPAHKTYASLGMNHDHYITFEWLK